MTPQESNKIIAEFMSWEKNLTGKTKDGRFIPSEMWIYDKDDKYIIRPEKALFIFSSSLDALVPVWKKLTVVDITMKPDANPSANFFSLIHHRYRPESHNIFNSENNTGKTIQEAAAMATAKAIESL